MRSKVTNFYNCICSYVDYDLFALSETWLSDDICNNELFPSDIVVYRKDRNFKNLQVSKGGGVLLGIRDKYKSTAMDLTSITSIIPTVDIIGAKVTDTHESLIVLCVYIPPRINFQDFELLFELISTLIRFWLILFIYMSL